MERITHGTDQYVEWASSHWILPKGGINDEQQQPRDGLDEIVSERESEVAES